MIGAIILAAGSSRRFGDDKRQAKLPNGKMVIEQTIDNVLPHFDEVVLTLRNGDIEFEKTIASLYESNSLIIFRAPDSALGMGHSLANSISQVNDWDGVFVFLGDMPHIRGQTVEQLKAKLQEDSIVIPIHRGKRGHPVGFAHAYFGEISQLTGDTGAKPMLEAHPEKILQTEVDDPGVLQDIDHQSDL